MTDASLLLRGVPGLDNCPPTPIFSDHLILQNEVLLGCSGVRGSRCRGAVDYQA